MILDKKYKEPPIGVIGAGAWGTVISKLQLTIKWHIFTVILPLFYQYYFIVIIEKEYKIIKLFLIIFEFGNVRCLGTFQICEQPIKSLAI